ncbi:MAG: thioredoxin-like domain-containing protein [Negativicutes bacterium]|jgi:thiol-disulfide isomerase/thioredoxin
MLVIFKPECKDCQLELPLVQKIAKEYSEKLNVTLIVYGKQSADIAEYVKQFQDFSNISVCADPEKLSKTQFAIRYVPCIVLFDAKGKLQDIIQTDNGIVEQSKIEIAINRYLPVLE